MIRLEKAGKNLFSFIIKSREVTEYFKWEGYIINLNFREVVLASRWKTAGFLRVEEHKIKSRFQVVIQWLQVYYPGYTSTKVRESS